MGRSLRTAFLALLLAAVQHADARSWSPERAGGTSGGDVSHPRRLKIEAGAPRAFVQGMQDAYRVFAEEQDYGSAANMFSRLVQQAERGADWRLAFGLRNASLYASGQHEAALHLICTEARSRPWGLTESEELFEIHAHARALALARGRDHAADVLARLRSACGRATFSAVWLGIPLAKMEHLRAGRHVTDEGYVLREKDRVVLEQFAEQHPSDEFVDYAHYFLHDFYRVRRPELRSLGPPLLREDAAAFDRLLRTRDLDAFLAHALKIRGTASRPRAAARMFRYLAENFPSTPAGEKARLWQLYWSPEPLESWPPEASRLQELLLGGALEDVVSHFRSLPPWIQWHARNDERRAPPLLRDAVAIERYLTTKDPDPFLKHAIGVRGRWGHGRPHIAARMLWHLAEHFPATSSGEKARFLHFVLVARQRADRADMDEGADALGRKFVQLYPASDLIDDAYAELALCSGDAEQSRKLFDWVYKQFPASNAADNALYYLLKDAIRSRSYGQALSFAAELAAKYPAGRIAKQTRGMGPEIEAARSALADRRYLGGLALLGGGSSYDTEGGLDVAEFDPKVLPRLEGFVALRVVRVSGREVRSDIAFLSRLWESPLGALVPVVLSGYAASTGLKQEIHVSAPVVRVGVFDVISVAKGDVLNVHSDPTHRSRTVGKIPPRATCVRYAGRTQRPPDGRAWFEVTYAPEEGPRVSGWVNSHFLTRSETCLD